MGAKTGYSARITLAGIRPRQARLTPSAKPGENRYAGQNNQQSIKRVRPVGAEGVVEKKRGGDNEQSRNKRVAEHAIRPRSLGIAAAEDENRAGGDHVEKPFREDGERKKLAEVSSEQQENNRQRRLHTMAIDGV